MCTSHRDVIFGDLRFIMDAVNTGLLMHFVPMPIVGSSPSPRDSSRERQCTSDPRQWMAHIARPAIHRGGDNELMQIHRAHKKAPQFQVAGLF